jgi:hypothetical protein
MKPVIHGHGIRGRPDELGCIIAPGRHRRGDNVSKVPGLQNIAQTIHLHVHSFKLRRGIQVQYEPSFSWVDVVMNIGYPRAAVIFHNGECAIEFDAIQN